MKDENGCYIEDSTLVIVIPEVNADFTTIKEYNCINTPSISLTNLSSGADKYLWTFGENDPVEIPDSLFTFHFEEEGIYSIQLESRSHGRCSNQKSDTVYIADILIPNVITPNGDEKNEKFVITTDTSVELTILTRWGNEIYHSSDYQNNWAGDGLNSGVYYYEVVLNNEANCNGWVHVLK